MCQDAFFPCVQGIKMRRSEREEQKQMYNQKEETTVREKNSLLFLKFDFKIIYLKINVKKELLDQFTILPEKMSQTK